MRALCSRVLTRGNFLFAVLSAGTAASVACQGADDGGAANGGAVGTVDGGTMTTTDGASSTMDATATSSTSVGT